MRLRVAAVALCLLLGLWAATSVRAAEPPQVLEESVSGITETSAVLEATIDPGDGGAYYQFQVGPERDDLVSSLICPSEWSTESACEGPQAIGVFPIEKIEGEAQEVQLDLEDLAGSVEAATLKPGTGYRFRVVVARAVKREDDVIEWEEPTIIGMNQWFTTLGMVEPAAEPSLVEAIRLVSAPVPSKCRMGSMRLMGRACCPPGFPPRKADGRVRCVRQKLPFRLLSHPVGFSHLPRSLQSGLMRWLPAADQPAVTRPPRLRGGTVYLGEVGVYGVGIPRAVCIRAWGGPSLRHANVRERDSVCAPMRRALKRGLAIVSFCTGTERPVQITGLVPDGVTSLGVDRSASGEIEEVIPVKSNAFVAQLDFVGVVLHGIGPQAGGFEMKFPLRDLGTPARRRCLK